jgi:hypothetical protein
MTHPLFSQRKKIFRQGYRSRLELAMPGLVSPLKRAPKESPKGYTSALVSRLQPVGSSTSTPWDGGASLEKTPIGEALTGAETEHGDQCQPGKPSLRVESSRSQCVRFRERNQIKIEQGLTAQRIYQDFVYGHGFTAKYHSVRRFVGNHLKSKELPVRRIEVAAGYGITHPFA